LPPPGSRTTASSISDLLELADWRRRVARLYGAWRDESGADPEAATLRWRAARDVLFREHPQSPLPPEARADFPGVPYWPYDPCYRLTVSLERSRASAPVGGRRAQLPVSGQEPFAFRLIGLVRPSGPLSGTTLSVFWLEGYAGGLFIAFRDATSGRETYGAGRYLVDSAKGADLGGDPAQAELVLDFNMAYHPSCVYDARWNCPLAPRENWLRPAIPVGERLP
jgi:uncharacterized protein